MIKGMLPVLAVGLIPLVAGCAAESGDSTDPSGSSSAAVTTSADVAVTAADAAPEVGSSPLAAGLYQSAYSARNRVLWVTSAVGRPPVKTSALYKVNPRTREIVATYVPPVTDTATGALEAVYGVAVDDEHNNVWVTNTRNNSVAVYNQKTGEHLASLPGVAHAREVVVDELHNVAWATGVTDGTIVGFDTRTFAEKRRVTVQGANPAGLAVNKWTGTVYATDLKNAQIIEVSPRSETPRLIPTGAGPISIDLSRDGRTAYTADQTAGTLSVVDLRQGKVTKTIPTGTGALSLATNPRTGDVLVVNRGSATVSVVDVDEGVVRETITTNANPNHVTFGGGTAFIVDKSAAGADRKDTLYTATFCH
ncbi:YncE family protein [Pendulispora albinea]|uniref:YncE family protein n=1 Tax=Pendulispora albinea TaxID=2741071 RepID=A0ABZ2LR15_9BACT